MMSNSKLSTRTNFFISENDIYVNMDKWNKKEVNICFVTGFSGSGKSTLAKKFALKHKAVYVETDMLIYYGMRHEFTKKELYDDHSRAAEILWMYVEDTKKDPGFMKGLNWKENREQIIKELIDYVTWLETKPTIPDRYVIEGVDVTHLIPAVPKYYEYPIIFKGTSVIKSMIRKMMRDEHGPGDFSFMKELISWYISMADDQNFLRNNMITPTNFKEIKESESFERYIDEVTNDIMYIK